VIYITWINTTITSKYENLTGIRNSINDKLISKDWDEESRYTVLLVLDELISNAIKHGNSFNLNKKVHISYKLIDKLIEVRICDEGDGLFPEIIKTIDEIPIDSDSGRGMFLVENLVDSLEFKNEEKMVIFTKSCINNGRN